MIEKKILYVDDEVSQRDAVKKFLTLLGYAITVYERPEDIIDVLKEEYFPLIITDLEMPGMDGVTLCRKIRKISPATLVYALSGHVAAFGTEKLESTGFDGYLFKPIDTLKFETAIEGAFDKIERRQLTNSG